MSLPALIDEHKISSMLNILYVEDDEDEAQLLCDAFESEKKSTYNITHSATFTGAIKQLKNKKFEVILLDLNLPDGFGLNGINRIKDIYPEIPVVIISGNEDENTAMKALQMGAQEYIVKTHINNNNIIKRVLQSSILRAQVEEQLKEKAYTDPLTKLPNRLAFEQTAKKMMERAARSKSKEALLFIDLNKFKEVNDTYGHEAGNAVLIEVAKRLKNTLRKSDLIARYAGDEFICYLDSARTQDITHLLCQVIVEKIIEAVEKPIIFEGTRLEISLSIGIAIFPEAGNDFCSLLKNADAAMYDAKNKTQTKFCFVENASTIETNSTAEWREIIKSRASKISNQGDKGIAPLVKNLDPHFMQEMRSKYDKKFAEFAFLAAHDLRAPVRKIITFSEMLDLQYDDLSVEERRNFSQRLSASGKQLNHLIDDLLIYAQVVKNSETLTHICLSDLVSDVLDDLQLWLKENNAKVQVESLPKILGYKTQIRHIFMRLISNAIKYAHHDRKPKIKISHVTKHNQFIISIKDNGVGIEEEYREQIFKPFKRLHSSNQIEGTGMGLAICERAMVKHGGEIWVAPQDNNEKNQGTCFKFSFPLKSKTLDE